MLYHYTITSSIWDTFMKTKWLTLLIATLATNTLATNFTTTASVISIEPTYLDRVISEPYESCYIKDFTNNNNVANELLGGLIGGAIGNRFGGGSGQDVMTVAGALLGASIASNNHGNYQSVSREVCETRYQNQKSTILSYYRIGYTFNDNIYYYNSKSKPISDAIRIKVNIRPY